MSNQAEELISAVRNHIEKEDFPGAVSLLNSPGDRSDWTSHEQDEIACLVEFLDALNDSDMSMIRL
jgi:hypothetical protein